MKVPPLYPCKKCLYNLENGCGYQIKQGNSDTVLSRKGDHRQCFKPLPEPPKGE